MSTPDMSTTEALRSVMEYCIWPSVSMLLGTLIVVFKEPPETFKLMTQHFAAGIILSAVSTELLPQLRGCNVWYTLSGFMAGVVLMMVIEKISGEEDEDGEVEDGEGEIEQNNVTSTHYYNRGYQNPTSYDSPQKSTPKKHGPTSATREKRRDSTNRNSKHSFSYFRRQSQQNLSGETVSLLGAASKIGGVSHGGSINSNVVTPVVDHMENGATYNKREKKWNIPLTLAFTVYLDGFMDGFLIGISTIAGATTGLVMTIALTVEMTFLGLTFSASTVKLKNAIRYPLICGAPLMILIGGILGTLLAVTLNANPEYQTALISFGAAALLYLVTEELLIEAHESGEGHKWYVDICFFVGFIASVLVEQGLSKKENEV